MRLQDIEKLLESAKYRHLSDPTLVSYRDSQLDEIEGTLAEAHLKLCLVCERRLTFLREEAEALKNYAVTENDRTLIRDTISKLESEPNPTPRGKGNIQALKTYINDLLTDWVILFGKPAMRGADDGDEVWRYESKDRLLTAWAILETDASLTVHFSSTELAWEGTRMRFRLGPFSKEVTLQREGDSGLAAKIEIPRRERAKKMKDISIEVL
jgi:hypothetical protein